MSNFYEEVLLREEYNLVVKLQKDKEFSKYVDVKYKDRGKGKGEIKNVLIEPSGILYPESYIVDYLLPVFIADGQLRRDWHGTATITLEEPVLTNRLSDHGPFVQFNSNFEPFNNHVHQCSICSGNAWAVAKDHGLWHFIISLGALINQDEFVCSEGYHFNGAAYDHWVNRRRRPVTNINWPLDLLNKPTIVVQPKAIEPEPSKKITVIKITSNIEPVAEKKPIIIISKTTQHETTKKITIIKKNHND